MIFIGIGFITVGAGLFFMGRYVPASYWGWHSRVRSYVGAFCFALFGILCLTVWR
jgi:hypothetical protein